MYRYEFITVSEIINNTVVRNMYTEYNIDEIKTLHKQLTEGLISNKEFDNGCLMLNVVNDLG